MSLSADLLSRATPTRLICRGGRWTLELTRLEAVDRDVYQPRLTRLEGAESILAALRRSEEGQHLASGAAQIMRSPRGDEDRAFEVNEGDWVPSNDGSMAAPKLSELENDAADNASAIAELRAELLVLRGAHSRLRERVMALEATLSGSPHPNNARAPRGSRAGRRRSEPPPAFSSAEASSEPLANPAAFAATQASPGLAPPPQQPAAAAAPAPAPPLQSLEDFAKAIVGEQPLPLLTLPALPALLDCLATLMGSAPAVERATEEPLDKFDRPQICKLLDDEGRERGAVVLEIKAAVLLGAGLLALPHDEALRQVADNDPSEDALLAMAEICNNLTGPVNAVAGNQHVRSTALSAADVSALPPPRARLDLTLEGSRFAFVMF
ncbi:MAG TPA: hypothetical protein VHB79_15090 [Polyangiaceae bacterium]|nr:hypothetical protein [Polyangiaceae bacterium]